MSVLLAAGVASCAAIASFIAFGALCEFLRRRRERRAAEAEVARRALMDLPDPEYGWIDAEWRYWSTKETA